MTLTNDVTQALLHAESKALATYGPHGINVVPVSTIRIIDGNIQLMNYFLHKTLENIQDNNAIAMTCWSGLHGYQIKGTVSYTEEGETFDEAKKWIGEHVPERVLKGLLTITPTEIYNISPQ